MSSAHPADCTTEHKEKLLVNMSRALLLNGHDCFIQTALVIPWPHCAVFALLFVYELRHWSKKPCLHYGAHA